MPGYGTHGDHHDRLPDVIAELADENVDVDQEVIEIDEDTWAIHGRIAYDGEMIVGEFASEAEAWTAVSDLTATDPNHTAPPT